MRTMKIGISFLIALTLFVSCEETGLIESAENEENVIPWSDLDDEYLRDEYLRLAYDKNYKHPVGFYHDEVIDDPMHKAVYYDNTLSIVPANAREGVAWSFLSTSDINEARNWSNLTNTHSSVNRKLISERKTEKYFEFLRIDQSDGFNLLSRVHRSEYFIPKDLQSAFGDLAILEGKKVQNVDLGIYNGSLAKDNVKELVEYVWSMFYDYLHSGKKVIVSEISENDAAFECYIQSLFMVGGDWGVHDMIYIIDNTFVLDKKTKVLTLAKMAGTNKITGKYNSYW